MSDRILQQQTGGETRQADALDAFERDVSDACALLRRRLAEGSACGSRALAYAMAQGLPPRMTYTVAETSSYTGVPMSTLRDEMAAGRIHATLPHGQGRDTDGRSRCRKRW